MYQPQNVQRIHQSKLDHTLRREKPAYAVLDHILSQPALELPIKEMVALCRRHGVREVAVDGAHAIGLVKGGLDVEAVGADWYFSNLHKWCFQVPKFQRSSDLRGVETRRNSVEFQW